MTKGLDASMNCVPHLGFIQQQQFKFAGRYYSNLERTHVPEKVLKPKEAAQLSASGLDILAVWEYRADIGYFTQAQGRADGEYAYRYAHEVIHQPMGSAIYFAVDFDASDPQLRNEVIPYFQGVRESFKNFPANAQYDVGIYGSGLACTLVGQAQLAKYTWLAGATGWRGTSSYTGAHVVQGLQTTNGNFQYEPDDAPGPFGGFRVA